MNNLRYKIFLQELSEQSWINKEELEIVQNNKEFE
jgi:hypothetical protein